MSGEMKSAHVLTKRKRDDAVDELVDSRQAAHRDKRPCLNFMEASTLYPRAELPPKVHELYPSQHKATGMTSPDQVDNGPRSAAVDVRTREVIEAQFSLEILLKHNELRLIHQELAKCQVALEQLRRCHLVPYPLFQDSPASMADVAEGRGPAVVPKWAPPYGVVDGPYSRHYASFLTPDPRFDGISGERGAVARTPIVPDGRSTRNSNPSDAINSQAPRSARNSVATRLASLPSGYPAPKLKNGPCTLKRNADGMLVKLVCIDCKREDFSSTQGFINHCRIAHHRDFKSHEEAAIASGQVVEAAPAAPAVMEQKPLQKPPPHSGLVHPIIKSTPAGRDAYLSLLSHIEASKKLFEQGLLPGISCIPRGPSQPPQAVEPSSFVPSNETPHLSRLLMSRGFNGNLGAIVTDAKTRVEPVVETPDEDVFENETPLNNTPDQHGSTCSSSTSHRHRHSLAHSEHEATEAMSDAHRETSVNWSRRHHDNSVTLTESDLRDHDMDLSPHTVSSNNAPSLVSDDEDDASDAETSKSIIVEDDSDVAEIDIEDEEVQVKKVASSKAGIRQKSKDDRHVTFVSPVKEADKH